MGRSPSRRRPRSSGGNRAPRRRRSAAPGGAGPIPGAEIPARHRPSPRRSTGTPAGRGRAPHRRSRRRLRPIRRRDRKILRQQPVQTPRHLGLRRRFDLKRRGAAGDGLAVDAGDGCDIAWTGGADIISAAHRSCAPQKKTPQDEPGALKKSLLRSAAVAEQPQQHQEQVDEVEIEPQRAHDRLAAGDGAVVHRAVHLLDVLRVVGGEPDEHEHAND
jgi:hypothetical protein